MPRESTGPELALRKHLHSAGLRYRVHVRDLPGRPDIALTRARIAVFVDGCFWHRCPEHGSAPKNNRGWWDEKLSSNQARDRRNDADLEAMGWLPIRFWEHDDPASAAAYVEALWRERTGRPPSTGPPLG